MRALDGFQSYLELIFSMLGEASTAEISRKHNAQGFEENRSAARAGSKVARREDLRTLLIKP
jgi:DNA-damage-inducible protein D